MRNALIISWEGKTTEYSICEEERREKERREREKEKRRGERVNKGIRVSMALKPALIILDVQPGRVKPESHVVISPCDAFPAPTPPKTTRRESNVVRWIS
jgi:hypothetical protein